MECKNFFRAKTVKEWGRRSYPADLPLATLWTVRDEIRFKENFGDGKADENVMVLGMCMVLREVKKMPLETVRALAIEIAMLGTRGISPTGRYNLKGLPNRRDIPGAEILAWYYVTWMRVFPENIDMLGLPYKETYARAVAMLDGQTKPQA